MAQIEQSPYVRVLPAGRSPDGRPLRAIVVTDFFSPSQSKARVMICAGQHGDEPNPIVGLTSFLRDLVNRKDARKVLKDCVLIVVPIVNPDGAAANRRTNAAGADVNRDWMKLATEEARFVDTLVSQWHPHVILDLHEWRQRTSVPGDEIEVFSPRAGGSQLQRALALRVGRTAGLTMLQCHGDRQDLLHRRFSSEGYASYLIETACDRPPQEKHAIYRAALYSAVEAISEASSGTRSILSPGSDRYDPVVVAGFLTPKSAPRIVASKGMPVLAAAMSALGFVVLARMARKRERKPCVRYRIRALRRGYDPDPARLSPFSVQAQTTTESYQSVEPDDGAAVFRLPPERINTGPCRQKQTRLMSP